jgi:hypothetical protein
MIIEPYKESLVLRDLIAELPHLSREKRSVEKEQPIQEDVEA